MYSYNNIQILGNVGTEVESIESSTKIFCKFPVAVTNTWIDKKTNQKKTRTEWFNIVIYNSYYVQMALNNISKGDKVFISGEMVSNKWIDKNTNAERISYNVEISQFAGSITLCGKKEQRQNDQPNNEYNNNQPNNEYNNNQPNNEYNNDQWNNTYNNDQRNKTSQAMTSTQRRVQESMSRINAGKNTKYNYTEDDDVPF